MTYDALLIETRRDTTYNIITRSMRALEFILHPRRIRECLSEISIHRRSEIVSVKLSVW